MPVRLQNTIQDYNGGSAPFPYATECTATVTFGVCDPEILVAEMDFPAQADPIELGVSALDEDSAAVGLVSVCSVQCLWWWWCW